MATPAVLDDYLQDLLGDVAVAPVPVAGPAAAPVPAIEPAPAAAVAPALAVASVHPICTSGTCWANWPNITFYPTAL